MQTHKQPTDPDPSLTMPNPYNGRPSNTIFQPQPNEDFSPCMLYGHITRMPDNAGAKKT